MASTATQATGSPAVEPAPGALDRALAAYWSCDEIGRVPAEIRAQVVARANSDCTIAQVPAWAGKPRAFLKIFREPVSLGREVEGLRRGAAVASGSPVAVPRVLQVNPAHHAVLLEYVEGQPLGAQLRRGLLNPAVRLDHVWRPLGTWLRAFHDAHPVDGDPADFLGWQAGRIEGYLADLHDVLGPHWLGKLERLKAALAQTVAAQRVPLVLCHFDFALHNVIVSGERIWVTDFAYAKAAPRALDVERWWDSLDYAVGFFPATARLQARIRREFAEGYGGEAVGWGERGERGELGEQGAVADLIRLGLQLLRAYGLSRTVPRSIAHQPWRAYLLARTLDRLRSWADATLLSYGV